MAALVAYHDCTSLLNGLRAATVPEQTFPPGIEPLGKDQPVPADGTARTLANQDHSATNDQETGVDEPDTVKTDGRRIVTVARGELRVVDAASHRVTGTLALSGAGIPAQLLMSGNRVLIVTQPIVPLEGGRAFAPPTGHGFIAATQPKLTLVDISGTPKVVGSMTVQGTYVDARMVGSVLRIVVRSTPRIVFPPPRPGVSSTEADRRAIQNAPLGDWLTGYTVTQGGASQTKTVPCERVSHPSTLSGGTMATVFTVNLATDLSDVSPVSVVAGADTVYGTTNSLYITDHRFSRPVRPLPRPPGPARPGPMTTTPVPDRTDIYKFALNGSAPPEFKAAGSVSGTLLSQYSMSEYNGDLRVAATSGSQTSVDVLAPSGNRLDQIGTVGGLGENERVYAVRFIGPAGYVVTFRQVDPLYAVDLADPAHPRLTGELTISGYSAYLHPIGGGRLLGVGQDVSARGRPLGTQVSLFDTADPARPRKVSGYRVGSETSAVEFDTHAFLYMPSNGLTVLPLTGNGPQLLVLSVTPGGVRAIGTIKPQADSMATERSVVTGNTLWTISDSGLQGNDTTTLAKTAWVAF